MGEAKKYYRQRVNETEKVHWAALVGGQLRVAAMTAYLCASWIFLCCWCWGKRRWLWCLRSTMNRSFLLPHCCPRVFDERESARVVFKERCVSYKSSIVVLVFFARVSTWRRRAVVLFGPGALFLLLVKV